MFKAIDYLLQELFDLTGIPQAYADVFIPFVMFVAIILLSYLILLFTRTVLLTIVARIVKRTRSNWEIGRAHV